MRYAHRINLNQFLANVARILAGSDRYPEARYGEFQFSLPRSHAPARKFFGLRTEESDGFL
jgi:hypothetical protein